MAWFGAAGKARYGRVRLGLARQDRRGEARRGMAWHGKAGSGEAGKNIKRRFEMITKKGVQDVVNQLYLQTGHVKPSDLVEAARPKDSPAHNGFTWDNKKAGHEYRLMQARTWIRQVEVVYEDRKERFIHVPSFSVSDTGVLQAEEGYYKPISIIAEDKDEYSAALGQARARLSSAKEAYADLKKAAPSTSKVNFNQADRGYALVEQALTV